MTIPNLSFGSAPSFGDWTRYAGFDSSKPMMGIVPPIGQEATKQPIAPTFAQIGQRVQDVGSQLSQGNFQSAAKTFVSGIPAVAPLKPVQNNQPQDLNGDGMIFDFED